ncbi:hypothetical protein ACFQ1S_14570 [Kibdelosporangium lantanae]|uniref:Uncharacterized protein n=1 Tax=Kibdelosporangium lantanae TaxID=1497396 RepID=A0ABW3M897_9PSEU
MTDHPTEWRAVLPGNNGADLFEPDITEYGYLGHSFLEYGNRRFPVVFCSPDGLWVEAVHRANNGRVFYEPNVIAVEELTFENIHAAVAHLSVTDFDFGWMPGEQPAPSTPWTVELSEDETTDYWEMSSKEYLINSSLVRGHRRFPVEFYTPTRLGQNAHLATEGGNVMYEPNVVALEDFTFDAIRAAVTHLADTGRLERMLGYSDQQ